MDLPGLAIKDFYQKTNKGKLYVHDQFGPKVEMPISLYFRNEKQLPKLESLALGHCKGKVLEIGAGAGSHALILQENKIDVTALEISPASCEVMTERGVKQVVCEDFFAYSGEKYDTLLLLMNGIGLCADIDGLRTFLKQSESLLEEEGAIIFDSSDIAYMYEESEFPDAYYYGQARVCYEYKGKIDTAFNWLYIDQKKLKEIAQEENWDLEIIYQDHQDQYLAKMKKKKAAN
ncbi:class I SAM-dependent methyltransferase [Chryseobacterium sp. T1]